MDDCVEFLRGLEADPDTLYCAPDENDRLAGLLHGECHLLALAIHRLTGFELRAWLDRDGGRTVLAHAYVLTPEGDALDARGRRPIADLARDFEICDPDCDDPTGTPVAEADLIRLGEGRAARRRSEQRILAVAEIAAEIVRLAARPSGPAISGW